jgi:hypothetical protein
MKRDAPFFIALLLAAGALLAACGTEPTPFSTPASTAPPPSAEPTTGGVIRGTAQVEEIEVLLLESFPVQVRVIARGSLPDGCTAIDAITQERAGQEFRLTITTARPADAICTQALVPFEENVPLDVQGLQAGTYTVNVNGVSRSFELAVDNVLPTEPAPATELQGGVLATFEVNGEQFQAWVTNSQTVQQILDLAAGASTANIPNGRILRGPGPAAYNAPWSWHLDPEDIEMTEMTTEVCDGMPSYVEEHLDEFVDTIGRYCPWSARLVDVQVLSESSGQPGTGTNTYTSSDGWSFEFPATWDRLEDGFVQETASGKTVTFHSEATSQANLEAWLEAEIARKLDATEADNSLAETLTIEQQEGLAIYRYAILSRGDGSETLLRTTVFFDGASRYELYAAVPPVGEAEYQAIIDSFWPAPGDGPLLTWHREGGIAGFCDDMIVYASGDAYAKSCKGAQTGELRHSRLTGEQVGQVTAWLGQFQPFEVEQTDPATADAMAIRLDFGGKGMAAASDADKQEILEFAAGLYAAFGDRG